MKHKILLQTALIFGLLLSNLMLFAQIEEDKPTNNWNVQFNIQHQDLMVGFDYGQLGVYHKVNIRPMYSVEIQRYFKNKKRFLNGQISYYDNLYHDRTLAFQLGYFTERNIYKGLFVVSGMELGLARVKSSDTQYILEDGKWMPMPNEVPAFTTIMFGPRLDFGYRIMENDHPIDILLKSHLSLRLDAQVGGLPFYGVGVGVRYGF